MGTVVYLDTSVLRDIVSRKHKDRNASKRLFASLGYAVYEVKVPQAAVGEAVTTVMRDFEPSEWEQLVGRIMRELGNMSDPATCFPPPDPAVAAKASEAMREVKGMTKTDALIVAQVMMDPESQKLITTDNSILYSQWLEEEEREMRGRGERSKCLRFSEDLSRKDTRRRS